MEIDNNDKLKAEAFIGRLQANSALKSFSALQREEQILQFLTVNARQLYPTLSSASFFPGRDWEGIWKILSAVLYEKNDEELMSEIRLLINRLDLTFFSFLSQSSMDEAYAKQVVIDYMQRQLGDDNARRMLAGTLSAIENSVVKNFITEIYGRRKYVHFEIIKVEKVKLGEKEAENMISLIMLLKPMICLFSQHGSAMKNTVNGSIFQHNFTETIARNLAAKSAAIPAKVFLSAMNANASFIDNPRLEATARVANIISSMCRNYKPDAKKDRGADTAMKSWINVARKNYKFYGYDIKMLDELYNIAADNGW